MNFLLDRKNYIAFYVIGYLLRGMIYHFLPWINEILLGVSILWPILMIGNDIKNKAIHPDPMKTALLLFTGFALLSTLIHFSASTADTWTSLWGLINLLYILFTAPEHETDWHHFFTRLSLFSVAYIGLLALASVILLACYRADISLPMGLASAERIFTYGHMGEETRFCGLFGYSTDGGNLCTLGAALSLYLFDQYQNRKAALPVTVLFVLLFSYTVYLLDVRTSMLALLTAAGLVVYRLLRRKCSVSRSILILLSALIIGCGAVFVLKRNAIAGFVSQLQEDPYGTLRFVTTGRSVYWQNAFGQFLKHPLLGQGWNNAEGVGYFDCHNLLINLLLWTGICGTGAMLGFFVLLIRRLIENREQIISERLTSLVILLCVILITSMLERAVIGTVNTNPDASFFWLSAGTLAYLGGRNKERTAQ